MAEETALGGIVTFLGKLGFFDVVLPFLLIFTIIDAILDKTLIFGTEPGTKNHPRRNLNAIVSFVTAFMFIAAKELVAVVNQAVANIALLAVLGVFFMILIGLFHKEGELDLAEKHGPWFYFMTSFMGVGIFIIFLHALEWDDIILDFFLKGSDFSEAISAIIFLVLIAGFIYLVSFSGKGDDGSGKGDDGNSDKGNDDKKGNGK